MAAMKVLKWGNSLALRLPMTVAKDARIKEGSTVNLRLDAGRIIVEPLTTVDLDELLEGITQDNLHGEVVTGKPKGRESW